MVDGEAKELGGDGVSFAVIGEREDGDKVVEVVLVLVFDTKVIHHQDKGDEARDMAKKTGGRRFMEAVSGEVRDERRVWESLPASLFNPYIVFSMRKRRWGLPQGGCLMKGRRLRRERTESEKRWVESLMC